MAKAFKNRASKKAYLSTRQLTFVTFESPFSQKLPANNRWVQLAENIPWDDIVKVYTRQMKYSQDWKVVLHQWVEHSMNQIVKNRY